MAIDIIFNDVDECISKNIPSDGVSFKEEHLEDITKYANLINNYNGPEFVLCTGRALCQLGGILDKIKKIRWIITENGSIIHDLEKKVDIDLALNHPAKKYFPILVSYTKKFVEEKMIPKKRNMLTIDVGKNKNPEYFNDFIKTMPHSLIESCTSAGLSFNWDPTAINITLPISKYHGVRKLLEVIANKKGVSFFDLVKYSAYIGDSISDIEGMKVCNFAATISNGDEKNKKVQEYIQENYVDKKGYISKYSYGKGNRDCIKHLLNLN